MFWYSLPNERCIQPTFIQACRQFAVSLHVLYELARMCMQTYRYLQIVSLHAIASAWMYLHALTCKKNAKQYARCLQVSRTYLRNCMTLACSLQELTCKCMQHHAIACTRMPWNPKMSFDKLIDFTADVA